MTLDVGERRLRGELKAFEDARADLAGILDIFKEVSVLFDLFNMKTGVKETPPRA